jgi:predicted TIM-barrel fold metal-dependent hydrolase
MPVFDSLHEVRLRGVSDDQGVAVFWDNQPASGLSETLNMLAERTMVLKTGHIAPAESLQLIRLARDAGVEKIVVTHATGSPVMATPKEQKEMADLGALIEHCLIKFLPISRLRNIKRFPNWKGTAFGDLDYLKASLESVGPERCIAATDAGQIYNPSPLESFIYLLSLLEELGCSAEEMRKMVGNNPRRMLGISGTSANP